MPRCDEIHNNRNCTRDIEDNWKYCPHCGRLNGHVELDKSISLVLRDAPVVSADVPIQHMGGQAVRLRGGAPENPSVKLKLDPTYVTVNGTLPIEIRREYLQNEWDNPQVHDNKSDLSLQIDDGIPTDPWDPSTRWRPHQLRVVYQLSAPANLHIEPAIAIFHTRQKQRKISVANLGGTSLKMAPVGLLSGYQIEGVPFYQGDYWELSPGETRIVKITCQRLDGDVNDLQITMADGSSSRSLTLVRLPAPEPRATTDLTIGIDFGTSNTSIFYRQQGSLEAHAILDATGKDRFPTLIYITQKENGQEKEFLIGNEALKRYDEDGGGRRFMVRELKTLLRSSEQPYTRYHDKFTTDYLLQTYLEKLKELYLDEILDKFPNCNVRWCFSLPVLDDHIGGAGDIFRLQKERTIEAAERAGFGGIGNAIEVYTEPYCAATYMVLNRGEFRFPNSRLTPEEGDWVCIFDSGGGTTDVVLGQVHWNNGQLDFEEISTLGIYRTEKSKDSKVREAATFGGEVLTRDLAFFASRLGFLRLALLNRGIDPEPFIFRAQEAEKAGRHPIDEWPDFAIQKIQECKVLVAEAHDPNFRAVFATGADGKELAVTKREFDTLVDRYMDSLCAMMDDNVFHEKHTEDKPTGVNIPTKKQVQWIFPVGGNSIVKRIGERLLEYFQDPRQQRVQLSSLGNRDRMLAVGGGTVWAPDARRENALPYGLTARYFMGEDSKGTICFNAPAGATFSERERHFSKRALSMSHDSSVRFEITARVRDLEEMLTSFQIDIKRPQDPNSDDDTFVITTTFRFEGRTLMVETDESGAMTEKWKHEV